jgi:acetolactate synthase small subunit
LVLYYLVKLIIHLIGKKYRAVLDYSHTKLVERELLLARVSILPPDADKSHTDEIENIDASQNEQILHQVRII